MVDITLLPAPEDAHRCEELIRAMELYDDLGEKWSRDGRGSSGPLLWGKAVERVEKRRGRWFAHNGEYAIPVHFCPFCGSDLQRP